MTPHRALGLIVMALCCAACQDVVTSAPAAPPKKESASAPATPIKTVNPAIVTRPALLETTGKVQFNEEQLVRVNAPVITARPRAPDSRPVPPSAERTASNPKG